MMLNGCRGGRLLGRAPPSCGGPRLPIGVASRSCGGVGRDDGRWVGGSGSGSGAFPNGLPTGLALGEPWISSVRRGVRVPLLLRLPPGTGGFKSGTGDDMVRAVLGLGLGLWASLQFRQGRRETVHVLSTRHPVVCLMVRSFPSPFYNRPTFFSCASWGKRVDSGV
jgi:hypothetical protein